MHRLGSAPSAAGSLAEAPLPIDAVLPEILERLEAVGSTLLLHAPPGAGKTTRVPLALLHRLQEQRSQDERHTVLMLEPRRLAAKAAAQRLAASLKQAVGETVGYRVRLEQRCSKATRLEVLTDGLFLRRLQGDPALAGVSCVIFDEFHERRADTDLALALLRESRPLLAPELRLLVMSATLDLTPLARQLPEAAVICSEGQSFSVDLAYQPPRPQETLAQQVVRGLEQHWLEGRSAGETVLVFLPGQREILHCQRAIQATGWGAELELAPLHGGLPLGAQSAAMREASNEAGKVVLASAVAESSLTIAGVRLVIDSGLSRRSRFDPGTGMDGLVTVPASQASATQRRGRAGRLGPGRCLRLWSPAEQQRRPLFDLPELLERDPLPVALQLAQWGAGAGASLPWLDPPPKLPLLAAIDLLGQLGATDVQGHITAHGRAMAQLGLHPRLAHMLLQARGRNQLPLACELAVLLEARDPLGLPEAGSDLLLRLDWLRQDGTDPHRQPLRQQLAQLQRQAGGGPAPSALVASGGRAGEGGSEAQQAAELIGLAYPEQVALARPEAGGRFLMRNGRGARLHPGDPLAGAEALAIARADTGGSEARILLALPMPRASLERLTQQEGSSVAAVRWDGQEQRVVAVQERRLGALVLSRRTWQDAPLDQVQDALMAGLREHGLDALPWSAGSRQLQQRLCLAHRELGPPWPERSEAALGSDFGAWLGDQLAGRRSLQDLQTLDLQEALWSGIPWDCRRELDRLLPAKVPVPSGRLLAIDYSHTPPVLAVRLQEMFGSARAPALLEGRLAVTLHLLSPAGRPVQITQDLDGFWSGSYRQVRAELRGRYPRHPWPEDPRQALPTSRAKPASPK
jgi:ATP-dependent helicase HrpB